MTKIIVALVIMLTALSALAQHRPGRPGPGRPGPGHRPGPSYPAPRPMPRPMPGPGRLPPRPPMGQFCSVAMIDNWHQVYRSYSGRTDYYSGQCRDAMNRCIYDLRFNRGLRCVDQRGRW